MPLQRRFLSLAVPIGGRPAVTAEDLARCLDLSREAASVVIATLRSTLPTEPSGDDESELAENQNAFVFVQDLMLFLFAQTFARPRAQSQLRESGGVLETGMFEDDEGSGSFSERSFTFGSPTRSPARRRAAPSPKKGGKNGGESEDASRTSLHALFAAHHFNAACGLVVEDPAKIGTGGAGECRGSRRGADRLGYLFGWSSSGSDEKNASAFSSARTRVFRFPSGFRVPGAPGSEPDAARRRLHQPPLRLVRGRRPRHRPAAALAVAGVPPGERASSEEQNFPARLSGDGVPGGNARVPGGDARVPGDFPGSPFLLPPLLHHARIGGDRERAQGHGRAPSARFPAIRVGARRRLRGRRGVPAGACGVREHRGMHRLRGGGGRRLARGARRAVSARDRDRRRAGLRVRAARGCVFHLAVAERPVFLGECRGNVVAPYNTFYESLEADLKTARLRVDALTKWSDPQCVFASEEKEKDDTTASTAEKKKVVERLAPEAFAPFIVPFRGGKEKETRDDADPTTVTQANPFAVPDAYVAALDAKVRAVASLRGALRAAADEHEARTANHHPGALQGWLLAGGGDAAGVDWRG